MPLEGVLQILKDGKSKTDNVLANKGQGYNDKIFIATKEMFEDYEKIKKDSITDAFLGFFSLLTSYCIVAKDNNEIWGPKRSLNIMPRTDFLTMYKTFAEPALKDEYEGCSTTLLDIISTISSDDNIGGNEFKWRPGDLRNPTNENWDGKADNIARGRLSVKQFLDTLQGVDGKKQLDLVKLMDLLTRHGQIGGLEGRMESVVGNSDKPAPVFEFRDLTPIKGNEVAAKMGEYEDKCIEMHQKAN